MTDSRPLVLIAPDSFKGSCDAAAAASALARGVRAGLGDAVRIREMPLADGGEGTLDALVSAWSAGGRRVETREVPTTDALGRARNGRIGLAGPDPEKAEHIDRAEHADRAETGNRGGTAAPRIAIIEAAEANGLPYVSDVPLRPLDADSRGVGLLVAAALDGGATEILLCVGGSATSDGGAGVLTALGARLLDAAGHEVVPGARGLAAIDRIDLAGVRADAFAARWRIAVDVENPLVGPAGAAAVFGPQKGAGPTEVAAIETGLAHWAQLLELHELGHRSGNGPATPATTAVPAQAARTDLALRPGMGAAGGLSAALAAVFGAELAPGAELVAEAVGLDEAIAEASLILTGEGRLDSQSLGGKVVSRILRETRPGTPVVAIVGTLALTADECREAGLAAAFSIATGPASLAELAERAPELLEDVAARVCGLLARGFLAAEAGAGPSSR